MIPSRTIRIFISSTFRDMHSERDYLIKFVFPELRERCRKKGLQLIDVDLRWGVSEEDAEQGKALEICLDEIENCRPFFIGILGERYGWTPEKYQVPDYPRYDWVQAFEKGHSITALEIYQGVLKNPEMRHQAFFYFRNPDFIRDVPVEKHTDIVEENQHAAKKLFHLKEDIKDTFRVHQLPGHITERYDCRYKGIKINWAQVKGKLKDIAISDLEIIDKMTGDDHLIDNKEWQLLNDKQKEVVTRYGVIYLEGLEEFGNAVLNDLWQAIEEEYPETIHETDPFVAEQNLHSHFEAHRTRLFIGREDILNSLEEYIHNDTISKALMLVGEPGSGKSALMAMAAKILREKYPDCFTLSRYVGASPTSMDIYKLLRNINEEIASHCSVDIDETRLENFEKLSEYFREMLYTAATKGKLVLYIDALNQLIPINDPDYLTWLPKRLPEGVKIICSTLKGAYTEAAEKLGLPVLTAGRMSQENCREMVQQILGTYRKTLSEHQMVQLLSKQESIKPLYLFIACEELRIFPSFEEISERIAMLAETIPGLFEQMFDRLEADHGRQLVKDTLCLIECSMYGLEEGEMLDLLKREGEDRLPLNIWSRLFRNLSLYLTHSGESNDGLLNFFHQQMSIAVKNRYITAELYIKNYELKLALLGLTKIKIKPIKLLNTEFYTGIYLYKNKQNDALLSMLKFIFEMDDNYSPIYQPIAKNLFDYVVTFNSVEDENILKNISFSNFDCSLNYFLFLLENSESYFAQGQIFWAKYFIESYILFFENLLLSEPSFYDSKYFISSGYQILSRIYFSIGDFSTGLKLIIKPINFMEELVILEPNNIDFSKLLSNLLNSKGIFIMRLGLNDDAKNIFENEVSDLRLLELNVIDGYNDGLDINLIAQINNFAMALKESGKTKEALVYIERVLKLTEILIKQDQDNNYLKHQGAVFLINASIIQKENGDLQQSKISCKTALNISDKLINNEPRNFDFLQVYCSAVSTFLIISTLEGDTFEDLTIYENLLFRVNDFILIEPKRIDLRYIKINLLSSFGLIYKEKQNYVQSLEFLDKAYSEIDYIELKWASNNESKRFLADIQSLRGKVYEQIGDFDKAKACYEDALKQFKDKKSKATHNTTSYIQAGHLMNKIAQIYHAESEMKLAIKYFSNSAKLLKTAFLKTESNHFELLRNLLTSLNSIGNLYRESENQKLALKYYQQTINFIEGFLKNQPNHILITREMSFSLNNIGNVFKAMGDFKKALEFFEKDLQVMNTMISLEPENKVFRRNLSIKLNGLGDIYIEQGNTKKALEIYEKSLKVVEYLLAMEPEILYYKNDLSENLNNIGSLYRKIGDSKQALEFYEKSLQIMEALINTDPDDIDFIRNLSGINWNLANIYFEQGDTQKAIELFEKECLGLEHLVTIMPEIATFKEDLSKSFNNVGNIYKTMGDVKKAFEFFEKDLRLIESLVAMEPERSDFMIDYAISHWNIYLICSREDELLWLNKVRNILEPMIGKDVNHPKMTQLWTVVNEAIEKIEKGG